MKNVKRRLRWGWIIGLSILVRIVFIGLTFPYMVVYSYLFNPGHDAEFYRNYFFENRAWISTGLGIPVFILIGYWFTRKVGFRANEHNIWLWVCYTFGDIPIELFGGNLEDFWRLLMIAHVSKLASLYFGVWLSTKNVQC